jgi:serine phosphatase RsbU (regulator of sigma subunit)
MEEADHWVTKYGYGMDETVATRNLTNEDVPLTRLARDTRAIVVIDDVQASDQPDHQVAKSLGIRSMIVIPLLLRGEVMGVLVSAHRRHDRPFDANEIAFAESMGKMLSLAVENEGAFATLERDAKYSMALGEVDREIHRSLDVQVIAESALAEGAKALGVELAFLEMREPDSSLILHVYRWSDNAKALESFEVPPCSALVSEIGATIVVDEAETDPRVDPASWKKWKIRSLAVSPLLVREQNIGSLCFGCVTEAHHFAKEEVDFVTKLASSLALAMENARLYEAQRNIAATLQRMLLLVPTSVPGIRFSQLYRSATQDASVGGDFYDILELEDGSVCLLIGDVSGHGVVAARAATVVRDTIAAFAGEAVDPEIILTRTNEILLRRGMGGFATVLLATVSADRRSLRFCSAGHPNLVVKRASGEVLMVGHDNSPPLGVFSDWSCGLGSLAIDRGDILFFYTDGLTEARRGSELFGEGRLLESIRAKAGVTLDDLPNSVLRDVLGFADGALRDDIAILAVSPSID